MIDDMADGSTTLVIAATAPCRHGCDKSGTAGYEDGAMSPPRGAATCENDKDLARAFEARQWLRLV
jgi:hypothetical protein